MNERTFKTAIDLWLLVLLVATAVASAAGAVAILRAGIAGALLWATIVVVVGSALPLWMMFSTRYTLTATDLLVRSGPISWNVPLGSIYRVVPTRNPLSSPAFSLNRLRIDYNRMSSIMVSPAQREEFVRELRSRLAMLGKGETVFAAE